MAAIWVAMRWIVRAIVWVALAGPATAEAASEVTRQVLGECGDSSASPKGLPEIAHAIDVSKDCLPEDDPRRPAAEQAEWQRMVDVYTAWEIQVCKAKKCVSNQFASWVDIKDGGIQGKWERLTPIMAGCFKWSGDGAIRVTAERPKYWTVTPVTYGKDTLKPGENIHQVLEVRNTRTGEVHILDGWQAAKNARSFYKWGKRAMPADIDPMDALRTHEDVVADWGEPSVREPCANDPQWMCDPSRCVTTSEELR